MKYLCLIYEDEKIWDTMPTDQAGAILGEYQTFTEAIAKSGQLVVGEALQPSATATTVRVRNGRPSTSHGPAMDMTEQLGGFYLVEAANIDEAVEVATRIPSARHGSVEVRPIMSFTAP